MRRGPMPDNAKYISTKKVRLPLYVASALLLCSFVYVLVLFGTSSIYNFDADTVLKQYEDTGFTVSVTQVQQMVDTFQQVAEEKVVTTEAVNNVAVGNQDVEQIMAAAGYTAKAHALSVTYANCKEAGYSREFALGMMANIIAEGNTGQLEYKNSSSYWNLATSNMLKYQGKVVTADHYSVEQCREIYKIWRTECPNVSGYGVGAVQWSSPSRRNGILDLYLTATTYTIDELATLESKYMLQELAGSYKFVVTDCEGKTPGECASTICLKYEVPANRKTKAVQRASIAENLDSLLANVPY